ncbi:MAG TPA: NEW3 domain-containing protein [Pirellulaceae bacterium]|jgi:uncharacterized repeat protein (TIGR01451 family)|nr:NEW3 domain-containing protein [Pirellulaceae bacterium]
MRTFWRLAAIAAALHASASIGSAQASPGYRWDVPPVPPPSIAREKSTPEPRLAPTDPPPIPRVESSRRDATSRQIDRQALLPASPVPAVSANAGASAPVASRPDVPATSGQRVASRPAVLAPVEPRRLDAKAAAGLPILAVDAIGDSDAVIGERTTFRIAVRNLGQSVARDVTVDVTVPDGIEVVATRPERRETGDGRQFFKAGSIPAGSEKVIEIEAVPRRAGAFDFQPRVRFDGGANAANATSAPLPAALALEVYAPDTAATGDRVTCRIVVRNSGGTTARDVMLLAEFPSTFEADDQAQDARKLGVIAPGESREATFTVTPRDAGSMPVAFRTVAADDVAAEIAGEMKVLRRDLAIEVEGPSVLHSRHTGVYRVSVSNPGETTLRKVVVRCQVPEGLDVRKLDRAARYEPHERILTLTLPEIAVGQTEVLQFVAAAGSVGAQSLAASAQAEGLSATSVVHDTEVAAHAELGMSIVNDAGAVSLGEAATIAVKLSNRGNDIARKVKIRVLLPEQIDAVSSEGETSREVLVPAFDLAAGEQRTVLFTVRGKTAGDHLIQVILNSATLDRGLLQEANVHFYEAPRKRVASRP